LADKAKFLPGRIFITPGALAAFEESGEEPWPYLWKHIHGDWGDLSPEDIAENELSLREGFRLLSSYELKDGTRVWIITESDRRSTTVLLPSVIVHNPTTVRASPRYAALRLRPNSIPALLESVSSKQQFCHS
jgi:hypothetical protein